jgi:hypothetical protein
VIPLASVYSRFSASLSAISAVRAATVGSAEIQRALGELVLLRLFFRLEAYIEDVTIRICRGSAYADGTNPSLLVAPTSRQSAIQQMRTLNRFKAGAPTSIELKWTMGPDIRNNAKFVIAPTDPFFATVGSHEAELDRLRRIRNHIAHGNSDTGRKFRPVVAHHYGAALPSITPGALLLSNRFSPPLLDQAIVFARVFARDVVRA